MKPPKLLVAQPGEELVSGDIGYPAGNALADAARIQGLNGIIYRSVRKPGGTCLAALFPHAVQSVAQGAVYQLRWRGDPKPELKLMD